ncbi:MAG: recombinase family protein [Richelia sp. RM1_1_1]|nr:recombinase family protein [Richelia sp. RM1_1_1]
MKVGYCRVSTREQSQTDALSQQLARLKKAGVTRIFQDIESGRKDSRSQYNQMLELCKVGEVKEIVITRIDRLSRSLQSFLKVLKQLEEWEVKLNILDSPVDDPNSPTGWFNLTIMGQLSEFESRMLSSRIRHGLDYFREQKKAAPRPPFGYARVDEKYAPDMTVNEQSGLTNWEVAGKLVKYFLSPNATTRGTCKYSLQNFDKKWTPAGFRYWLLNPTLLGSTCYNVHDNLNNPERWIVHPNTHEPLFDDETLVRIKEKFEENRHRFSYGNNKKGSVKLPLEGQMICGCCGYKLFIMKSTRYKTYRIRCKKRENLGAQFCSYSKAIRLLDVMLAVDKELIKRANEIAKRAEKGLTKETVNPEITKLHNQIRSLKSLPSSEIIDNAIKSTQQEIERLINDAEVTGVLEKKRFDLIASTLQNPDYWSDLPWEDKIPIYKQLVENVVILNAQILEVNLLV